jgi:hypothetical protein
VRGEVGRLEGRVLCGGVCFDGLGFSTSRTHGFLFFGGLATLGLDEAELAQRHRTRRDHSHEAGADHDARSLHESRCVRRAEPIHPHGGDELRQSFRRAARPRVGAVLAGPATNGLCERQWCASLLKMLLRRAQNGTH